MNFSNIITPLVVCSLINKNAGGGHSNENTPEEENKKRESSFIDIGRSRLFGKGQRDEL